MSGETETSEDRKRSIEEQRRLLRIRMGKIRHKVAVISGKGGVGKSTITAGTALTLCLPMFSPL